MSHNEKAASVGKWGTFLDTRKEGSHILTLYHIDNFFCEMRYDPVANKIVLVQGFTSQTLPEPYLDTIELPQL